MIVGVNGSTASTTIAGALLMKSKTHEPTYGLTGVDPLNRLPLAGYEDIVWGGWDVVGPSNLNQTIDQLGLISSEDRVRVAEDMDRVPVYAGVSTGLDYPATEDLTSKPTSGATESIELLRADIRTFRLETASDDIVVVNLSNPPRSLPLGTTTSEGPIASGHLYATAALEERCHFIEFTPSPTLSSRSLLELATRRQCQLAGRDGSTGQTMLKVVLGHLFSLRNLGISSWFSTNLLGNHDGEVLSKPEFAETKLADKTQALSPFLSDPSATHLVRIEYVRDRGDRKEAWDSVRLEGWLGSRHSMQIHWDGSDSFLAAPLIVDLVRLVGYGSLRGTRSGIQTQLGPFFKHPIGKTGIPWHDQYRELCEFYETDG